MRFLPDGIHTVDACCIFANMEYGIWNMKYEILNYDRMNEEKMQR
jgi:hypothetical protein